jgi:chromosome segregation ATPase
MSDAENEMLEDGPPVDLSQPVSRLLERLEHAVNEAKEKDERLRNSQFVIKKANSQLAEAIEDCRAKDATINKLKEEVNKLEKTVRKMVGERADFQRAQEKFSRLTLNTEKSIQLLSRKVEERDDQISRLSDFNQTLNSERKTLLESAQVHSKANGQQVERDLNKVKGDLKKAQKEVAHLEKENEKLRNQNRTLTDRYRELHQEFQARKIEELMVADQQFGLLNEKERTEPSIDLVEIKNKRRFTRNFHYAYHKTKVRLGVATTHKWVAQERRKRSFDVQGAFHVVKFSQSSKEKERQQLFHRYVVGKLGNIDTDFMVKLEDMQRNLKDKLVAKLKRVLWLALQEAKKGLAMQSELLTRSLDRSLWELETLETALQLS